ncbi:hypothetical protein [Mycolicibacterium sp. PDY-3]|uniref:hypothetical protein n=1 Tax=Mycolicibacterium sp. PDY-3 TaxID=3376069 RepID=UPI0037BA637E
MINNAEYGPDKALINEIKSQRRELDELRTTPQPIGNGSLNYAVFTVDNAGPFAIPAGFMGRFGLTYAPDSAPFFYDGREALHKASFIRVDWSVKVDVNDVDHRIPDGPALAGPEARLMQSHNIDFYASSRSPIAGQFTVWYQMFNLDTVTHNYWLTAQVLIPRPALKPQ